MGVRFSKYEGLGNDFVLLEADTPQDLSAEWTREICDRHVGVGADGVLSIGVHAGRPFMRVHNADGSHAEMCGNGIRCVAAYLAYGLAERHGLSGDTYTIETDAGPHRCRIEATDLPAITTDIQRALSIEVEMAVPSLTPETIPLRGTSPLVDAPFELRDTSAPVNPLRVTAVSMGNPHLVCFDTVGEARWILGPLLAADSRLPESANIGFAQLTPDGAIDLAVLERGTGWTRACGTGACAAAVAAVYTGRAARHRWIEVRLPGGSLLIFVGHEGAPVRMKGPARHVFDGIWPRPPL